MWLDFNCKLLNRKETRYLLIPVWKYPAASTQLQSQVFHNTLINGRKHSIVQDTLFIPDPLLDNGNSEQGVKQLINTCEKWGYETVVQPKTPGHGPLDIMSVGYMMTIMTDLAAALSGGRGFKTKVRCSHTSDFAAKSGLWFIVLNDYD